MAIYFLPQDGSGLIIGFGTGGPYGNSGDLIMGEHHGHHVTITEHPVEVGSNVADHIRVDLDSFSVDLYLTNTPITTDELMGRGFETSIELPIVHYKAPFDFTPGAVFREAGALIGAAVDGIMGTQAPTVTKAKVLTFDIPFDRPREVWQQLKTLQDKGTIFSVVTTTTTYESMVIENLEVPRVAKGGSDMTVAFKTLRTVSTANVAAPKAAEKRGSAKVSKGSQSADPTDPKKAVKLASVAIKLFGGLLGGDPPP